ncbi:PREDICTED: uncharacterized protein LOC109583846 isoform X2 [Amphimedon queenslandica]|uniref:Uncharacterized protein n=1 Tax=Amphimedon queenslandica TaxID=400682 RepID=A0A1X7UEH8_AMPQE|nr:PREDICTED: uncharacterized protein LOC109583846 isoform X2 [Amphimedon queenslandica]|eukprot:XP_019854899.1 PREDICTED: uncharacterized protein LOC109583846 isoform X2 [Amphimedon queenslandica]
MKTLVFFFMTLSVCALALPSTKSYHSDHYSNRNKVTNMNNEASPPEEGTSLLQEGGTKDIEVKIEGEKICVYYKGNKLGCVDITAACGTTIFRYTFGCADDEELFADHCYKKCSLLANETFPIRIGPNACAGDGCPSDWEYEAGLCYPECEEHYTGLGSVCWGHCSHFCGEEYTDMGLYCYQWWPPKSCTKPKHDRGAPSLPYIPLTDGEGCSGFGVNNKGKCPFEDLSSKLPIDICKKQ